MNKLKKIEEKVSNRQRTLFAAFMASLVMFGYWDSWQYIPWSLRISLLLLAVVFIVFAKQADMYSEQVIENKQTLLKRAEEINWQDEKNRNQKRYIDAHVPMIEEVEELQKKIQKLETGK
ncbi:hypothetical protein [Weissella minor]|uniref:hypothetical protein n=1 Tax=Weissella minor TaxID=1620 RepID=UPI003AF2565C